MNLVERKYDLIVVGATGYTGGYVVEYLRSNPSKSLEWAIAGRSLSKLENLKERLNILQSASTQPGILLLP